MSEKKLKLVIKVAICGDSEVGKTTLIKRYITGAFDASREPTKGVSPEVVTVKGGFTVFKSRGSVPIEEVNEYSLRMQIYDMGGQEQWEKVIQFFFKGAYAVLYCFELGRRETFEHIPHWHEISYTNNKNIPLKILVGTKADLVEDPNKRPVTDEEIEEMRKRIGANIYFETSSKTGLNVNELFKYIADNIIATRKKFQAEIS